MAWPDRKPTPGEVILDRGHYINQGLVGWWLFNENGGTILHDYSGYGNEGTLNNIPFATAWEAGGSPGSAGYSLELDGDNDFILIRDSPVLDLVGSSISISLWMNSNLIPPSGSEKILHKQIIGGPQTNSYGIQLGPVGGGASFVIGIASNTNLEGNITITANEWVHVAVTHNQLTNITRLYVNGIFDVEATGQTATIVNSTGIRFGRNVQFSQFFDGKLDNIRIFNRPLISNEVLELFEFPFVGILRPPRRYFVPAVVASLVSQRHNQLQGVYRL